MAHNGGGSSEWRMEHLATAIEKHTQRWDEINNRAAEFLRKAIDNRIRQNFLRSADWGVFRKDKDLQAKVILRLEEQIQDSVTKIYAHLEELVEEVITQLISCRMESQKR